MVNYYFKVIKGFLIGKVFYLNYWIGNIELKLFKKFLRCNFYWETVIVIGENGV